MSGGEYEHAYLKVIEMANHMEFRGLSTPARTQFHAHLKLVAEAMRAVEWADSGDYNEEQATQEIEACLTMRLVAIVDIIDEMRALAEDLFQQSVTTPAEDSKLEAIFSAVKLRNPKPVEKIR